MKRLIFAVMAIALASPAFTQVPASPSDQEIAERHKVCNQVDHLVPIGAIRNGPDGTGKRPEGAGGYKPEYKALCEAIDAEHGRRDLAAKAKKAEEIEQLNSIVGRIK